MKAEHRAQERLERRPLGGLVSPVQVATPDPHRKVFGVCVWGGFFPYIINSPQWEEVKAPEKPGDTPLVWLRAQCARQDDKIKHREK